MSKHRGFVNAALGMVVGLGIALLFLVWAVPGFRDPTNTDTEKQHLANVQGGNNDPIKPAGFWEIYTTPRDTYAQWIASISGALGLGVSIAAVFLVWRTLELNRTATNAASAAAVAAADANKDARELFAIEQRPWLSIGRPEISAAINDGTVQVYFRTKAENIGESPAFQAELRTQMFLSKLPNESVVGVRRYGEESSLHPAWENDHKLIFHGKNRELWTYSEEAIDPENPPFFIRIFYCVVYRGNGIDRTLATAGEVILSANIPDAPGSESLVTIDRYVFYGMGYAT